MANTKTSGLTALTAPVDADLLPIVDISDLTDASTGTTKKITKLNLLNGSSAATPQLAQLATGKANVLSSRFSSLLNSTINKGFHVEADTTARLPFGFYVTGDAQLRYTVNAGGQMEWGDGTSVGDVNLYRSAANTLKTDDTFIAAKLGVGGDLIDTITANVETAGGIGGVISTRNSGANTIGNESRVAFRSSVSFNGGYYSGLIRSVLTQATPAILTDLVFHTYNSDGSQDGPEIMRLTSDRTMKLKYGDYHAILQPSAIATSDKTFTFPNNSMTFLGNPANSATGNGLDLALRAGSATTGDANGGSLTFSPGAKSGSGSNGTLAFAPYVNSPGYVAFDLSPIVTSGQTTYTFPEVTGKVPIATSGAGVPTGTAPKAIGLIYVDTAASKVYISKGVSAGSDWLILN